VGDARIHRVRQSARFLAAEPGRVAWAGSHPAVTAPIVGARTPAQLEDSFRSIGFRMTPELRAEISALSPEPPLATDREEERLERAE
jgi:aryl-alcohol dehydrogenase-like predicted oxidoreductase